MNHSSAHIAVCVGLAISVCWPGLAAAQEDQADIGASALSGPEVLPAVDGINAKLSPFVTGHDARAGAGLSGSVSLPLSHSAGLQIDAMSSSLDINNGFDSSVSSLGAHLFLRDPSKGLIGAYADYVHFDEFGGVGLYAGGIEGALYLDRVTLNGIVGLRSSDLDDDDFVFARTEAAYYPTDNLKAAIGYDYNFERNSLFVSTEWAFTAGQSNNQSLFAVANLSEGGELSVQSGLTFYIGNRDKPLIRRHREDDPLNYQSASLTTFNVYAIIRYCAATNDGAPICQ